MCVYVNVFESVPCILIRTLGRNKDVFDQTLGHIQARKMIVI